MRATIECVTAEQVVAAMRAIPEYEYSGPLKLFLTTGDIAFVREHAPEWFDMYEVYAEAPVGESPVRLRC